MNKEILIESFYSGWFENKKDLKLNGEVIAYMSKELDQEFLKNLKLNKIMDQGAIAKVQSAISKKSLIPAYTSESWLGDIFDTFFNVFTGYSGVILGFYDGKRIVVLTTNIRDLSGSIGQRELYDIIVHEYQHKFAHDHATYSSDPNVIKTLREWYTYFIEEYFGNTITPLLKNKLLKFWTNIKSENLDKTHKTIEGRFKELVKIYNESLKTESQEGLERLSSLVDYTEDKYMYDRIDPRSHKAFWAGHEAYKKMNIKPHTLVYQEFVIASEVTAVMFSGLPELGNHSLKKFL